MSQRAITWRRTFKECNKVLCGDGRAEVVALVLIAPQGLEELQLFGGFDTLGNDLQTQAVREGDDGSDDGSIVRT